MSLLAWYPLLSDGKNQGLDGIDLDTMGTVEYTTGKLGGSAVFLGNAANCLHRPYFSELTNNFTWCCWFNKTMDTTNPYQYILSQGRDYYVFGFNILISNGVLRVNYGNGSSSLESRANLGLSLGTPDLNTWYHVAVTVDGSGVRAYLNGELKATGVYEVPDYKYSAKKFVIGKMAHLCTSKDVYFPFYGQICDVRVYDECISPKEIKELSKGLMLHYKLSSVGCENLSELTNSKVIPKINALGDYKCKKIDHNDYTELACTTDIPYTSNYHGFYFNPFSKSDDKIGKTYTWSFYGKCNVEKSLSRVGHEAGGYKEFTLTTEWQKFTHTWTFTDNSQNAFIFYANQWNEGETIYIKDVKIEEGDKVTPWCPSKSEELYNTLGLNSDVEYDCSGYGNDGTIKELTKVSSDSMRYNSSYNFTNYDRLNCANIPFENMEQGTMSFWIKFNNFKNWTHYVYFANAFNWTGQENDFIIVANISKISEEATTANICIDCCSYITSTSVVTDKWYHIAITWDAKNYIIKKYINGNKLPTNDDSTNKRLDTYREKHRNHGIGNMTVSKSNIGDFNMSDFRIYATNLSEEDIKTMCDTPISITKDGTLISYELEEV